MSTALAEAATQLPEAIARRGIDEFQWRTLSSSLFPGARPESVLMVIDYCRARGLDPMKKPCHIVPMEVKDVARNLKEWRDVVMPGVYEHRITAHRTGLYLGHSKAEYGPSVTAFGVEAPEWCEMTMYRWHPDANRVIEFPVRVLFEEAVNLNRDGKANQRWSKAPVQMLTKCTEAAGLREAFPEEIGGEQTVEEMDGRALDIEATGATVIEMPQRKSEQPTANGVGGPVASAAASNTVNGGSSPSQPAPQDEEMPAAADRLVEVMRRTSRDNTKTWWTLVTARGVTAYTWSSTVAGQLDAFLKASAFITLDTEKDKRGDHKVLQVMAFDPLGGAGRDPGAEG